MTLNKRDSIFLVAVALLICVLAFGSGREKGASLPLDARHGPCYDALKSGRSRAEVELICTTCHSKSSLPLPKGHPPKEQCLICHKQITA